MAATFERYYTVKGQLNCLYRPESTEFTKQIAGIEVQLWQKNPMNITFLGKGLTDETGVFNIVFEIDSPNVIISEGKISDVFIKAYYNGVLITGDNPYTA